MRSKKSSLLIHYCSFSQVYRPLTESANNFSGAGFMSFAMTFFHFGASPSVISAAAWVIAHPPANKSMNISFAGRNAIISFAILFLLPRYGIPYLLFIAKKRSRTHPTSLSVHLRNTPLILSCLLAFPPIYGTGVGEVKTELPKGWEEVI